MYKTEETDMGIMTQRIGFDNDKYIEEQSRHIRERIAQFGQKLYLELGGKLLCGFSADV